MEENIPWQQLPDGMDIEQGPLLLPQDLYDKLMALPPGTDVSEFFDFEPGWDLTVTTSGSKTSPPTSSRPGAST